MREYHVGTAGRVRKFEAQLLGKTYKGEKALRFITDGKTSGVVINYDWFRRVA
jgi:hypothetical protein